MQPTLDQDEVVISGVGGHYPECDDLQEFRDALLNGTEILTDNAERWKPGKLGLPSKTGKVSGIDKFDAVFFGMHRKLTDATDPMSRLLMERVFEAIFDAGINPRELRGTRTAVFIGSALSESENIFIQTTAEDGFGIMGHNRSMMANRVSYYFDFKGPSYALDTSFCSGISALELGKRAIDCGEVDNAIVGAATLSFHPEITKHFADLGQICDDAITKPFSKDANGWVRSEAAICILLQRHSAARRVYASVLHVKVSKLSEGHDKPLMNQDHRHFSRHLTEFYDELHQATGITVDDIDYLEAQGAGFKDHDELEMTAVDSAICSRRARPLLVGSCSGQTGIAEASSGMMMLSKVLVAMETGVIAGTKNITKDDINPKLKPLIEGRLQLVTENTPLPGKEPLVAISNFGVANLFGHAVLRANTKGKVALPSRETVTLDVGVRDRTDGGVLQLEPLPRLVFMSARNDDLITGVLEKVSSMTTDDPEFVRLTHDVFSSTIQGHLQRAYSFVPKVEGLPQEAAPYGGARRPIWFVYSGMGSQWPGMARHLLRVQVFREAIERCHRVLEPHGVNLMHIITTDDKNIYDNILHSFVGIAAVQVGLTDVLHSLGIHPDGIIGHSVGELGCGYADGCFTAEQMILAAHARGKASIETELIKGMMAAVGLGYSEVKPMLPETIEVACRNSKTSCTISGPAEDMLQFVQQLKDKGVFAKAVNVSNIAYHSRYIAPAGPKLLALLKDVLPEPKPRSERWVSTSVLEEHWGEPLAQTSSAEYHTNNLLSSVYFEEGSKKIPNDAICIEIAPHGLLQAILKRSLDGAVTNVPLTQRDAPDGAVFFLQAIGKLYLAGPNPQIDRLYEPVEYPVSRGTPMLSPLVRWDHTETWYTGRYSQQTDFICGEKHIRMRCLDPVYAPYRDFTWQGRILMTPAVILDTVIRMIYGINDGEPIPIVFENIHFFHIVDLPVVDEALVYVLYQRGSGHFEVSSASEMKMLATGRAFTPEDGAKGIKKMWAVHPPTELDQSHLIMSHDDVYDELSRRSVAVKGKLKSIKKVVVSQYDVQGRVQNNNSNILLLDSLLQLYTLMDSESQCDLRVPRRIQRIIMDSDLSPLHADLPEKEEKKEEGEGEEEKVYGPPLEELVFRLHRASATLRCANIEVRGFSSRPFAAAAKTTVKDNIALDMEQFVAFGERTAPLQRIEEFVSAGVQLASQQISLQPLSRQNTETLVGILDGVSASLHDVLQDIGRRVGNVLTQRVAPEEAIQCDLLVTTDAELGYSLLAPHAILLAQLPKQDVHRHGEAQILLQQTFGSHKLVLLKKPYGVSKVFPKIVEVDKVSQLSGLEVSTSSITYLVWRSLPDHGIPALLRDQVRTLPGSHRVRSIFLLDPTAPKFSPTHPFYASKMKMGMAVNVLLNGAWGNMFLRPRQLLAEENPGRALLAKSVNRLVNIPNLKVEFLGLNGDISEPTNIEVRAGHILDITWIPTEDQPRVPGLLDYAGTSVGGSTEGSAVMGVMDATTLAVDPILQWAVPAGWSMEDAASVPYAYAMAYLTLHHMAAILPNEPVLIHDGWSAVGQAALDVALAVGGPVYTTYRTEEEHALIQHRFPKLVPDNILSLQNEQFERDVARTLNGDRQRKGFRVMLSNLKGEGLLATLRCVGMHGRIIQINGTDTIEGKHVGLAQFIKSTALFGVDPSCLVHLPENVRCIVRDLVQAGVHGGVVRPIDRTVLPVSHVKQAVSFLDGGCTDKVVLEVKPSTLPSGQRFLCNEKMSYLVVGGSRSEALLMVDWLLSRGARCVLLAGLPDSALSQVTLRRLALMRARWGAHVTTVPGVRADTAQGAATLAGRAADVAPLDAVFVLPSSSWRHDEAVQALDGVLRGPRSSVLCVIVEMSTPSSSAAEACAVRRRAGGRAAIVGLCVSEPHLRVVALDNALVDPQPVLHVNILADAHLRDSLKERLDEMLPLNREALVALGRSVDAPRTSFLQTNFGGPYNKSSEVPPAFLLAGLSDAPVAEMKPLAGLLLANAILLTTGADKGDIRTLATRLVVDVVNHQAKGPYTIVARGWSGCLALEMARVLEQRGERVALMLLDCAPQDLQDAVRGLGQDSSLQTWLLSSLLHLSPTAYDALETLPTWSARRERALALADAADEQAALSVGLDLVYDRLCALADYTVDFKLNQTVITLLRQKGAEADDTRGLEKVSKIPVDVAVVDGAFSSDSFWREAARVVSGGVYVGMCPMNLGLSGLSSNFDVLWSRLR